MDGYEMQNIGELTEIRKYINSVNMQGKWIALICGPASGYIFIRWLLKGLMRLTWNYMRTIINLYYDFDKRPVRRFILRSVERKM